mgnify:CR=1 FL=1
MTRFRIRRMQHTCTLPRRLIEDSLEKECRYWRLRVDRRYRSVQVPRRSCTTGFLEQVFRMLGTASKRRCSEAMFDWLLRFR